VVTVRIPAPLRAQTGGQAELTAAPGTVRAVLDEVVARHPGLGERLFAPDGRLHRFVNVFVGEEDVRDVRGLDTAAADGEVVTIVPAVAGGAARVTT
jgi:molybdopterin converting factor small subunit